MGFKPFDPGPVELYRHEVAERGMRPVVVVSDPPVFDQDLGLGQRAELGDGEQLVSILALNDST
ncbi:MAG: hypothetical protein U0V56_10395 [Actinomycetota bacterium]